MFPSYLAGSQNKTSKYLKTTKTFSMPQNKKISQILESNKKSGHTNK